MKVFFSKIKKVHSVEFATSITKFEREGIETLMLFSKFQLLIFHGLRAFGGISTFSFMFGYM